MKLFKLYTENKDYDKIMRILYTHLGNKSGFTVTRTEGHYEGKMEHGLVIDIMSAHVSVIYAAAYDIKKVNKQKSVLVVAIPCEVKFVQ